MTIRPYVMSDLEAVLALIRLNIPQYFALAEEADFRSYLMKEREDYFVMIAHNHLIGCGGINYFPAEAHARIAWDMLHPDYQRKGVGGQLLQHRLAVIRAQPSYTQVVVRTSQLAQAFYAKHGFQIQSTTPDYWAPGLHLYYMVLHLTEE